MNAELAQLAAAVTIAGGFALYFAVAWTVRAVRWLRHRTLPGSTQVN